MTIASIDIGTNTVLLLISSFDEKNNTFSTLRNDYKIPRLGRGLLPYSPIPDTNISRLIEVIEYYHQIISEYKCDIVLIKATNAMRLASNSLEIIDLIKRKYGYTIEVITGEKEAQLSYLGASSSLPGIKEKSVIDVGGGSTEIIIGDETGINFRKSFQIGAVSLMEMVCKHDPPTENEIFEMNKLIDSVFEDLNYEKFYNIPIIAVAGTPTTLACVKKKLSCYDEKLIERSVLTNNDLKIIIDELSDMSSKKIKETFGTIVEGREDVLLAGTLILNRLLERMKNDSMYVSGRGLRYGIVIDYISNIELSKREKW